MFMYRAIRKAVNVESQTDYVSSAIQYIPLYSILYIPKDFGKILRGIFFFSLLLFHGHLVTSFMLAVS